VAVQPSVLSSSGTYASPGVAALSTPAQNVIEGAVVYVQVAVYGTGPFTAPSISDSQAGVYGTPLASGNQGSLYLWVFRRTSPIASPSANFVVTVSTSTSTAPIEVMTLAISSDGGVDEVVTGQGTSSTTETVSLTTTTINDLVLFLGADSGATFSSWGAGQTGITYPTFSPPPRAWGSYQALSAPGAVSPSRSTTGGPTRPWFAVGIAITPATQWVALEGKPFVTVSPIGLTTTPSSLIANNGADFGPDTPNTATSGIQEALNSIGGATGPAPQVGTIGGKNATTTTITTPDQSVTVGSAMYVQIAMYDSSLPSPPQVTDSQGGNYGLLTSLNNGSINLFVFQRLDTLGTSTTFQVVVSSLPGGTVQVEVVTLEALNGDQIDVVGVIGSATSGSESASLTSLTAGDLVLFLGADSVGTLVGSGYGSGQTGLDSSYPANPSNIKAWGSYQTPTAVGSVTSTRAVTPSTTTWVAVSLALRPHGTGGMVYCEAGTYILNSPISNTGNYQTVEFEPGCTITGVYASLNPEGNALEALIWVASLNPSGQQYEAVAAFHHIRWIGNGCVINLYDSVAGEYIVVFYVMEYSVEGPLKGGIAQAFMVEIDGFEMIGLSGNAFWMQTDNGLGSSPSLLQQARLWKLSRIYVHAWRETCPSTGPSLGVGFGISSVRQIHVDNLYMDFTGVITPNPTGFSGLQIWSERGTTAEIWVTNSVFIIPAPSSSGGFLRNSNEVLEIQGADVDNGLTKQILFENCLFQCLASTPQPGGAGGFYIDDSNNHSSNSYVTNVEFRNCEIINIQVSFVSLGNYYGYFRFTNCRFPGTSPGTSPFSSSLQGRGPNSSGEAISSSVGTFTYQNLDGFDEWVIVSLSTGCTISSISFNSALTGLVYGGSFFLRTGDSLTVVSSGAAPNMTKIAK
jgi:hypothetical protein